MKKLSLVVALVLAAGLLTGPLAAPAASYQPGEGATFNVPKPFGRTYGNFKIIRKVENAIRHTRPTKRRPNPTIFIATYLLDRPQSVEALIRACRRGVSVRVVLDEDIASRPSRRLAHVLNADNVKRNSSKRGHSVPKRGPCDSKLKKDKKDKKKDGKKNKGKKNKGKKNKGKKGDKKKDGKKKSKGTKGSKNKDKKKRKKNPLRAPVTWGKDRSYVVKCKGACRGGGGGNMHSKFFVFSQTGKARHVVMVSSSNLNRGGAVLGWNDMYTMKNRPKSYQAYGRIHRAMTKDRKAKGHKVEVRDGPFTSRFFPMRRATKRTDPTFRDLGKVGCRSAVGRTRVYVSMFYWKGPRGNYLTDRLLSLARRGCRVNIIYGAPSVQMAERLRNAARARRIKLYDSRWDYNGDGWNEVRTHAKYVLVKGTFGKKRRARVVMTGSQNWVNGSLTRGDETTLNIARKGAYQQYVKHWNTVRRHSRRLPYNW